MEDRSQPLDLLSTSQTSRVRCAFGAPLVALRFGSKATIGQACCNHWECPCCGLIRAKQEYHKIAWGSEVLADNHQLYFWTITCRGRELSIEDAEKNYYAWTNVLLTNARTYAKRKGHYWAYAQVTERQHKTRNHPHSHIITTFCPDDAIKTRDEVGRDSVASQWFTRANSSAGLGSQHRISIVENAAAVGRYVAKYLFKDTMRDSWPKSWKRIRYSQNWPKPPQKQADFVAVLTDKNAWNSVAGEHWTFYCDNDIDYEIARHRIGNIGLTIDA